MAGQTQDPARAAAQGVKGVGSAVGRLGDHPVVEAGARAGYAVNGVLHLLIAWLALQVAFGNSGAQADQSGAMSLVAGNPLGWVLLIAVAVAFALLAIWQVAEAVRVHKAGDRAKAIGKAVVYAALVLGAVAFLRGAGRSGSGQAKDATAMLLDLPFGPALVVVAGLAVAGIGVYQVYRGWKERFREDLVGSPSRFVILAGRFGYIARGIALVAVGAGLVTAGIQHRPGASRGLDGALHDMVKLPWGQALVTVVAIGFAAFGVYSFARARYART